MLTMWSSLGPLIVGSALVPVQLVVTILLLRSASGRFTAVAWVAGMTGVRVLQGVLFGLVLGSGSTGSGRDDTGTSPFTAGLLLVVGILFLVLASRQAVHEPDPDAPPPRWLTMTAAMTPGKAFALGGGLVLIGPKFWVFTLSAIAIIGDAGLPRGQSILVYAVYLVLATVLHLALLLVAWAAPQASAAALDRCSAWLQARNRVIVIVVGVVFGTWFVIKGLSGLGVL